MTNDRQLLPADAESRRRLWREWIHVDLPTSSSLGNRPQPTVRRAETCADWLYEVLPSSPGVVEGLSAAVREALVGAELPASDRARLLRRAERLGLKRFEANLLIAAVQHRARNDAGETTPRFVATLPPERGFGVAKLVACAVAVEAIVGAILIYAFIR